MNGFYNFRNFPDFYYNLTFGIPGSQATVDILMLDTVIMCGNIDDFSSAPGEQPNGTKHEKMAEEQWMWLEKQLASSK